jgi:transposase
VSIREIARRLKMSRDTVRRFMQAEQYPYPPRARAFLFIRKPEKLEENQRQDIEHIPKAHPDVELAYQVGQGFVLMVAQARGSDLESGLKQAEHSGLPECKKMAKGIRLDYVAVEAAFSSEWSQGQVEAQVNCSKRQKRMLFGRANFDLLRLPVLCRI